MPYTKRTGYAPEQGIAARNGDAQGLARARWMLADMVSRELSGDGLGEDRVVRLAVRVGDVDPLEWLRAQRVYPRTYWFGREDGFEIAATGAAGIYEEDLPESPAALQKRLAPLLESGNPRLRYYGGLRFDASRETDEGWRAFGAYRFVLPRFELITDPDEPGGSVLICNLVLPRDVDVRQGILAQIENLSPPRRSPRGLPRPISRTDSPGWEGWKANIERALSGFSEGRMGKVVLARRAEFGFEEEPEPLRLMEEIRDATPGCFRFYVEPEEGTAFLGASPERLFRREGRSIQSEAVAGTRPRGDLDADDDELREELLKSAKDLSEHAYVRDSIRETLGNLCEELEVEERISEMKLARGRHLVSRIRGTLREGVSDAELLAALHPTPAVGGYPKSEALREIQNMEPFDRGWYAGPVGWIGADGAEFAVGIRSGLARGRSLRLFSGAGIVAGSTPDEEWAEIEQKIGDFTRVFGLDPSHAAR